MNPMRGGRLKSGRRRTACQTCSSLKIRCTGEKPSCSRCLRLGRECAWSACGPQEQSSLRRPRFQRRTPPPRAIVKGCESIDISLDVIQVFVEIYFSRIYNASLVLHQPSFTDALFTSSVKRHVMLSVCAAASIYHDSPNRDDMEYHGGLAQKWAEEAGKLVAAELDRPCEENIVTCINLTLFWFSKGHWQRAMMHEGHSTCTARVLGLLGGPCVHDASLSAEMSRRRGWAAFIINQTVSKVAYSSINPREMDSFPMPCPEGDFISGKIPAGLPSLRDNESSGSYYTELIKCGILWDSASTLAKDTELDLQKKISAIHKLDAKLRNRWRDNRESLYLGNIPLSVFSAAEQLQRMVVRVVFHQSLCVLHASIVPLFSMSPVSGESDYAQVLSAHTALESARKISNIFREVVPSIISQAPGFIGYAAYCSSAIQLPMLWCENNQLREEARTNISTNSEVMQVTGRQWKYVAGLGQYFSSLYKYHESMKYSLSGEPTMLDVCCLNKIRGNPSRTRYSILCYAEIAWSQGRVHNSGELDELDLDIGFTDTEPEDPACSTSIQGPRQDVDWLSLLPEFLDSPNGQADNRENGGILELVKEPHNSPNFWDNPDSKTWDGPILALEMDL